MPMMIATIDKNATTSFVRIKHKNQLSIPGDLHTVSWATPETTSPATQCSIRYTTAPMMNSIIAGILRIVSMIFSITNSDTPFTYDIFV